MIVNGSSEKPDELLLQTSRIYGQDQIGTIHPTNVADLLSQNSFGYASSFSPSQTTFNIRGATTGTGQGWDDTSEVTVLINGRRAGTANIGKLSTYDVDHIEVLRGPASVIYDSASMGGVINIVTKDGLTDPGNRVEGTFGSFDHYTGQAESGGREKNFDWYASVTGSTRDDYDSGAGSAGRMPDTSYEQGNLDLNLGYDLDAQNRLDFVFRHDGYYDAGHPGATYSLSDHDNRTNTSMEATYTGSSGNGDLSWSDHLYYVQDVDQFDWSQNPFIGLAASAAGYYGQPGVTADNDTRRQNLIGDKLSTEIRLAESNRLTTGVDLEYGWLVNTRDRIAAPGYPVANPLAPAINLPPTEYNNETYTVAAYAEDAQKFLDDKLTLQAGGRFQFENAKLLSTPFETSSFNSTVRNSEALTYRVATSYKAAPGLTFRASVGSGFRAVTPGELYSATQQGNGIVISGNPGLKDEYNLSSEVGVRYEQGPLTVDLAYFRNTLHNHVVQVPTGTPLVYQWENVGQENTSGLETEIAYDIAKAAHWTGYKVEPYATGTDNFQYDYTGLPFSLTDNHMIMTDAYQATFGIRGGKPGKWNSDWYAVMAGPNFELMAAEGLTSNTHVLGEKGGYCILNTRESYEVTQRVSLFMGVNNLLNLNYDPYFIGLNEVGSGVLPRATAGGLGSSAAGREFIGGFTVSF